MNGSVSGQPGPSGPSQATKTPNTRQRRLIFKILQHIIVLIDHHRALFMLCFHGNYLICIAQKGAEASQKAAEGRILASTVHCSKRGEPKQLSTLPCGLQHRVELEQTNIIEARGENGCVFSFCYFFRGKATLLWMDFYDLALPLMVRKLQVCIPVCASRQISITISCTIQLHLYGCL